jgi:N-methylhydantoinase A
MKEVVIPPTPGVTSAVGLLLADTRYDSLKTVLVELTDPSGPQGAEAARELEHAFAELDAEIEKELTQDAGDAKFRRLREVEMRYLRQGHELRVSVPEGAIDPVALERAFHQVHKDRFGYAMEGESSLAVNALLTLIVDIADEEIGSYELNEVIAGGGTTRPVWFDNGWVKTRVVSRSALRSGARETGPLIVEQTDTTIVVPPRALLEVDARENIVISIVEGHSAKQPGVDATE